MAVFLPVFLVLQDTLLDESHWLEHTLMVFLWSQQFQRLFLGDFDVHTHTVGIAACLIEQFLRSAWDALQMDIAIESVYRTQITGDGCQSLHRVVRVANDTAAKE